MSISSTTNRNDYVGNGAAFTYAYGFKIFLSSELLVTVVNLTGVETTLVLNTDYSVTGVANNSGGNIVLINASQSWLTTGFLTTGFGLTVRRVRALTQTTDIRNQGDFYPETHEDVFDKQVMISQQQQDEIDRTLKLPETEVGSGTFVLPPLINRANQFLGFGPTGDPIAAASVSSSVTASAFMQTVLDDTTPALARATLGIDGVSGNIALGDLAATILAKLVPSGTVLDDAGSTAPTGWVACDGTSYDGSTATYAALFARIGHTWDTFNGQSAPGGALFRVPKLAGMATIGAGAAQTGTVATTIRALAGVLGGETLPSHQHSTPLLSHSIGNADHATSAHIHGSGLLYAAIEIINGSPNIFMESTSGSYTGNLIGMLNGNSANSVSARTSATRVRGTTSTPDLSANTTVGDHAAGVTGFTGTGTHGVMQPSAVMNKIIKL